MAEITTTAGRRFNANDGESILDAAIRQGVAFQYSCKTGRCGTCKARVLSGETIALRDETGLSEVETSEDCILTCVRSVSTDVTLDIEDLGDVVMYQARIVPCRIARLERLSEDVLKVLLRLPPNSQFDYYPGQYLDVIGHAGVQRSYSIANASIAAAPLELHIRKVPGGAMSDYWFSAAKENDLLRLRGPLGTFFLREAVADSDLVFLATGTGIAPVKAMLEGLSDARHSKGMAPRSIAVYWGGRSLRDMYWEPGEIRVAHRFIPVLSRAGGEWAGARGYVQDALLAARPDLQDTVVYACGSDAMIHDARSRLVAAGLPQRRFQSDAFVSSGAA
jgi:CDP-4-dehydro-6-deoxyglucose reductase